MAKRTVVLVHGMLMTLRCWDPWVRRFEERGYPVLAVPWPGRDVPVPELQRRHPDPAVAEVGYDTVVDHHAKAIATLPEKPIIIGHSMGGLIAQSLLQRDLGAVGVAIDSAPPRGVSTAQFSFLRANWPVVNPILPSSRPYRISFKKFQYAFTNGMPLDLQRKVYDSQTVPESLRVPRESRRKSAAIDFSRPHAPILLTAGATDHIIPSGLNQKNFERYRRGSDSKVEFKEFPGRNHYGVLGGPGWEEVADFALDWAERQLDGA